MRLDYISVWQFESVDALAGEVECVALGKPPIEFSLTKEAEPFLVHMDRAQALANEVPIGDGALVERINETIKAASEQRAERTAAYLIARAEMDVTEPKLGT